jgi:hypothetical protein
LALAGCGGSVLIARDDDTYRRAIAHYRRTREALTRLAAPEDEQAMFMQAEGLFRYRFAPPSRSAGSYVAQLAASAIDLPALESVAGSLDLYSLRLKSYDGAVQLWETLLAIDGESALKPLALYRLGWAYRNTMASGFPRDSQAAFDELVASCPNSSLGNLARTARYIPWKSPGSATAWSVVPGLGQFYVGAYRSGLARLGIALVSATMIAVPAVLAYQRRADLEWGRDWPLLVSGAAGAMILTIDYSSSYQDALRRVLDYNERLEAAFEDAHADSP